MNIVAPAVFLTAFIATVLCLGLIRLARRPHSLERLRTSIETALNQRVAPLHATIEKLAGENPTWAGIKITIDNLRLQSDDGHVWVGFTQLTLVLPLSGLLARRSLLAGEITNPFHFSGANVDAARPLPPFEDLYGTAELTHGALLFEIEGGTWDESRITRGTVRIDGLGTPRARAETTFDCKAPASVALRMATTAPLDMIELPVRLLSQIEGAVEATIHLGLTFNDLPHIDYNTLAKVREFRSPIGTTGVEMTQGEIDISVTNSGTKLKGRAALGGIQTRFDYSKSFETASESVRIGTLNFGAIAGKLKTSGRLVGGQLEVVLSRGSGDDPWFGPVLLRDIRVLQAPLLARLLTMASLQGLLSRLTSDGLTVENACSNVTIESNLVRCTSVRISVDQLEMTGGVVINIDNGLIEGEGLLIPAASLQRLVGAVPVLGAFLEGLGRKDSPVLATEFTLMGSLSHPEIKVKPLSGLAPDILRELGLS